MSALTDRMAKAWARFNGVSGFLYSKQTVGPHVIEKTHDKIRVHSPDFNGEVPAWECKYCGRTGTHPDAPGGTAFSWEEPCEDFKPLESEIEAIRS